MKRTVIGTLFGVPGFYVSQPGDDLDNPQKNLLLDSRFNALEIHASGRVNLNRTGPINNIYTYMGNVNFPSLGYIPISYVSLIDNGSDVVDYPPDIQSINGRFANNAKVRVSQNEITVYYEIGGGQGTFPASFSYIVFRNPA